MQTFIHIVGILAALSMPVTALPGNYHVRNHAEVLRWEVYPTTSAPAYTTYCYTKDMIESNEPATVCETAILASNIVNSTTALSTSYSKVTDTILPPAETQVGAQTSITLTLPLLPTSVSWSTFPTWTNTSKPSTTMQATAFEVNMEPTSSTSIPCDTSSSMLDAPSSTTLNPETLTTIDESSSTSAYPTDWDTTTTQTLTGGDGTATETSTSFSTELASTSDCTSDSTEMAPTSSYPVTTPSESWPAWPAWSDTSSRSSTSSTETFVIGIETSATSSEPCSSTDIVHSETMDYETFVPPTETYVSVSIPESSTSCDSTNTEDATVQKRFPVPTTVPIPSETPGDQVTDILPPSTSPTSTYVASTSPETTSDIASTTSAPIDEAPPSVVFTTVVVTVTRNHPMTSSTEVVFTATIPSTPLETDVKWPNATLTGSTTDAPEASTWLKNKRSIPSGWTFDPSRSGIYYGPSHIPIDGVIKPTKVNETTYGTITALDNPTKPTQPWKIAQRDVYPTTSNNLLPLPSLDLPSLDLPPPEAPAVTPSLTTTTHSETLSGLHSDWTLTNVYTETITTIVPITPTYSTTYAPGHGTDTADLTSTWTAPILTLSDHRLTTVDHKKTKSESLTDTVTLPVQTTRSVSTSTHKGTDSESWTSEWTAPIPTLPTRSALTSTHKGTETESESTWTAPMPTIPTSDLITARANGDGSGYSGWPSEGWTTIYTPTVKLPPGGALGAQDPYTTYMA